MRYQRWTSRRCLAKSISIKNGTCESGDCAWKAVNHDKLMGAIAKRVEDKRLLKVIRAFLNAGVMEGGLVSPSEGQAMSGVQEA